MNEQPSPRARLRLWELPPSYHCSIVGTSLSLDRVRKILRKVGVAPVAAMSDYEAHSAAVSAAQVDGPAARLMHKALDRAHEKLLRRYGSMASELELREAWREDVARGAIPGAYWAILTHPLTSIALRTEVFGGVHMLSHRVGRLNRDRLRRFDEIGARAEALERKLGEERRHREAEQARHEAATRALEAERDAARAEAQQWKGRVEATREEALGALEAELARRERALEKAERRLAHALEQLEALKAGTSRPPEVPCNDDDLTEVPKLRRASPARSTKRSSDAAPVGRAAADAALGSSFTPEELDPCATCDLRGSVILYVGGERGMLPHLRRLARRWNSRLLHHDGGREDGLGSLPRLCARADAVLCPVDRVGHAAVSEVKRACTLSSKTFLPLRRASLDAFGKGLESLAAARAPENPRGAAGAPPDA